MTPGPIFVEATGAPLNRNSYCSKLANIAKALGMPPGCYTSHSLHIGGITYFHDLGENEEFLMKAG